MKMKLENLSVKSFATSIDNQDDVKGGVTSTITLTSVTVTTVTTITTYTNVSSCGDNITGDIDLTGNGLTGNLNSVFNC